jgi:hypothetical protein
MKDLSVAIGLVSFTVLTSMSIPANAQHFTNPVMNPGTRQTNTAHSPEPIPKGTSVGGGWVTTGGSTARSTPMPVRPIGGEGGVGGRGMGGVGGGGGGGGGRFGGGGGQIQRPK